MKKLRLGNILQSSFDVSELARISPWRLIGLDIHTGSPAVKVSEGCPLLTNQSINKRKICAKVRKIIQSQDFLTQFLKVKQYLKVSISFLTSPDHS